MACVLQQALVVSQSVEASVLPAMVKNMVQALALAQRHLSGNGASQGSKVASQAEATEVCHPVRQGNPTAMGSSQVL